MTCDTPIRLEILFGSVEVQTRLRPEGKTLVGEGRNIKRDMNGKVTEVTEWEPTGLVLSYANNEPARPWWKFWGRS